MVELKEKLNQAQLALSDAQETAANCEQKEKTMRNKLEKLQLNMDTMRIDSRRKLSELQVAKDDFDAEVKALKSKVAVSTVFEMGDWVFWGPIGRLCD